MIYIVVTLFYLLDLLPEISAFATMPVVLLAQKAFP